MEEVQFCPSMGTYIEMLAQDLKNHSGISLIVDYGEMGPLKNTLQVGK
jgi:SAM-dependent MidA family methyltransferase